MDNIQKKREYSKTYYWKHRQEKLKYNREYLKGYLKEYRQKHKQQIKIKAKEYYQKHRKKKIVPPPEIGCEHKRMLRYENKYQIYINGQVWSYKTGKWKKAALQSNGRYYFYCLSICKNKNKTQYIHKLIAENFILNSPIPQNYQVHHKDKNPQNNTPSNLLIVDSILHKQFHKTKERN